MTKIILVFDDEDDHMGDFNRGCMDDYAHFLKNYEYPALTINSAQLNDVNVEFKTAGDVPFVFVAYSHGNISSLNSKSGIYISTTTNHTCFNQAFFYTVSCHSATELGDCLIENGCYSFFGYRSPFNFWVGYKSFSQCANLGFFLFLQGSSTDDIYQSMITEYNSEIDKLYSSNSFVASLLLENRKALVYKGQNITINNIYA